MKPANICELRRPTCRSLMPFDLPDGEYDARAIEARIGYSNQSIHHLLVSVILADIEGHAWHLELSYRMPEKCHATVYRAAQLDLVSDVLAYIAHPHSPLQPIDELLATVDDTPITISLETADGAQFARVSYPRDGRQVRSLYFI